MVRFGAASIFALAFTAIFAGPLSAQHAPAASSIVRKQEGAAARAEDLTIFRKQMLGRDKSYSSSARAEAERRLAALEKQVATVEQAYFDLELARIAALADNGHTHYVLGTILRYYNRVPVRLTVFGEDFYVVRAVTAHSDLLGARLVSIDGHSIEELRAAGRSLWGGEAAFRDRFAFNLFESPHLLSVLELAEDSDAATYRFATEAGEIIERRLAGEPPGPSRPALRPDQAFFPQLAPVEQGSWKTLLPADKAPWALQNYDEAFRWRSAPEFKGMVVELRRNNDAPNRRISDAIAAIRTAIGDTGPTNLVLDMRWNGGGDLNTTRSLMKDLPKLVPGRIFVLTSPFTFSAAISSVGYLKQAAPERVTIVGEPVGDRLVFFAEGDGIDLPNSRGFLTPATERHDYENGCKAFRDCHNAVVRNPIAVSSLRPDIAAPWTLAAYASGRDPGMEAVANALR
jgi:hypothetical protein